MKFFRKTERTANLVDPQEAIANANEAQRMLQRNQPLITRMGHYFEHRQGQNGFGDDIEFTFRPKGASN